MEGFQALETAEKLAELTIEFTAKLMVTSIPVGFILGSIPVLIGLAVSGLVHIFKQA